MKINKDNALERLKRNVTDFLYPIKMGGSVDLDAYNGLLLTLDEITRVYKEEQTLPKALLNEIFLTAEGVASEACYIKTHDLNLMAEAILSKFNLLLASMTVDDNKRGIGRIV